MRKSVKIKHYARELIGKKIEVVQASNESLLGMQGKIINETKMTITIQQGAGAKRKMLLKSSISLRLQDTQQILIGKELIGRPEERIKWVQ